MTTSISVSRLRTRALAAVTSAILCVGALIGCAGDPQPDGSTFATFVDQYLNDFARRHPSIAAGNGLHDFDGTLDDFTADAIAREVAELRETRARLQAFPEESLTADERVDRKILDGVIDGWLLEQETLQNWRRNPMLYASAVTDGVHNLMTQEYAPAPERMRRIIGKLASLSVLLRAAQDNLVNPPRLLADRGVVMMRGASGMLANDVLLAFAGEQGTPLMDSLQQAVQGARAQVDEFVGWMEADLLPRANGDIAVGGEAVARRYRAEELIDLSLDSLVAIGDRELKQGQADFRAAAARLNPDRDALAVWQDVRRLHPKRGEVTAAAQAVVDSLTTFVREKGLVTVPDGERVVVKPAQPFDLGFASMHASPPLEPTPLQSYFYITDASPDQSPAQQDAWLERFNYASLTNTAAHEAMPGHWLHSQYMRKTPGKVRRIWIGLNPFPQPSSGQDGWAHYAEQLVVEQGYANGDPRYQLAQLSDALTRICRLLSGIHVHRGDWTLDAAQSCFENEAYVAEPAARREAERAVYDPTYGGYFLGKLGLLTLRQDVKEREGASFSLRAFHERLLANGIAPVWAHRQLLLPGDERPVIHQDAR